MYSVILVDDEKIVLDNMQKVIHFEEFGFSLEGVFTNPNLALEEIPQIRPQLIITDIKMPQMDGLEFTGKIRQILPDTEIVILSGHDNFIFAQSAVKLGVSDYLLKPIRKSDYTNMLKEMYRKIDAKNNQAAYMQTLEKMAKNTYTPADAKTQSSQKKAPYSKIIMEAISYLQEHFTENITLSQAADYTHVSKNYLSDLFRKELDTSFGNYLTSLRMNKAKQLLSETDMKMYEISEAVGYKDYAYFSTQFKKYTGKTLSEFKGK